MSQPADSQYEQLAIMTPLSVPQNAQIKFDEDPNDSQLANSTENNSDNSLELPKVSQIDPQVNETTSPEAASTENATEQSDGNSNDDIQR